MPAQDTSEGAYHLTSGSASTAVPSNNEPAVLEPAVRSWLEARIDTAGRDVTVAVSALPGRWLFRVECGAYASTIEHPTVRNDCASVDLASAVRRVAMRGGHSARIETPHGSEVRVSVIPAPANRS